MSEIKVYGLDSSLINDADPKEGFVVDVVRFSDYVELEKKYQELAGENVVLKSAIEFSTAPDMWEEHGDLLEYKYLDWYVDVLNKALDGPLPPLRRAELRPLTSSLITCSLRLRVDLLISQRKKWLTLLA